jgi:hypothetical protein
MINLRAALDRTQSRAGEFFLEDRGRTSGQSARRNDRARCDDAPCCDHRLRTNDDTVQQNRAHPDDRAGFDRAAFEQRAVTDGHVFFDDRRLVVRRVDDGVVLHVRAATNHDAAFVAAQHNAIPNAGTVDDLNIADDDGGRRDEDVLAKLRSFPCVFDKHLGLIERRLRQKRNDQDSAASVLICSILFDLCSIVLVILRARF